MRYFSANSCVAFSERIDLEVQIGMRIMQLVWVVP